MTQFSIKKTFSGFVILSGGIALLAACGGGNKEAEKTAENQKVDSVVLALQERVKSTFGEMPAAADPNTPLAQLGRALYFETALSVNDKMSCNSCHKLDQYGVDNEPTSPGHAGKRGNRNSPTVYNADVHLAQFWDGRAADLTEQAKGPILNPIEMGLASEKVAVGKIKAIAAYADRFAKAFPDDKDPITYGHIAEAIAAFEKTLRTPSPLDDFMKGDAAALNADQIKGLQLFLDAGCTACHNGPAMGGSMYQKFGLAKGPYWDYTKSSLHDRGRAEVTKQASDEFFFKVPSLRNIAKTSPYFHDGSVKSLEDAIKIMGATQLGRDFTSEEVKAIAAFLESTTGKIPEHAKSL